MQSPEELAREKIDNHLICVTATPSNQTVGFFNQTLIPQSRDQQFVTPDDGRKFTGLYNGASGKRCDVDGKPEGSIYGNKSINVQYLQRSQREAVRHRREARSVDARERIDQSAQLDRVSRVCISTIQRLYSMRSLFFWDRNTDAARRNQHEETGLPLWRVRFSSDHTFSIMAA